jgi:hypothetical protein
MHRCILLYTTASLSEIDRDAAAGARVFLQDIACHLYVLSECVCVCVCEALIRSDG